VIRCVECTVWKERENRIEDGKWVTGGITRANYSKTCRKGKGSRRGGIELMQGWIILLSKPVMTGALSSDWIFTVRRSFALCSAIAGSFSTTTMINSTTNSRSIDIGVIGSYNQGIEQSLVWGEAGGP
jgi:hypothetical protein